ncbi:MAG: bacillithiol system redox-active protein YtxJ [Bacteroidota bacterium]
MSLFKNVFGNSEEENKTPKVSWKLLTNSDELITIIKESNTKPIVIFKHSTRCGISRMVLRQFEKDFNSHDTITPYFLDLLNYRELSNEVASRFEVAHQSPQLLVIKKGIAVHNASHESIDATILNDFI